MRCMQSHSPPLPSNSTTSSPLLPSCSPLRKRSVPRPSVVSLGWFSKVFWLVVLALGNFPAQAGWDLFPVPQTASLDTIQDLSFVDSNEGWALVDASSGYRILHTTNGGKDWTEVCTGDIGIGTYRGPFARIHFLNPTTGWLLPCGNFGNEVLLRTDDGGLTFNEAEHPFGEAHAVCFLDEQTLYLAGEEGIGGATEGIVAVSNDGGSVWEVKSTPLGFDVNDIFFLDPMHGWVIGDFGTLIFTHDGGETWGIGKTGTLANLHCVRFADPTHGWVVGSEGALLATHDGGATWYQQAGVPDFDLMDLEVFSPTQALAVGRKSLSGIILGTTNAGATWFSENVAKDAWMVALARNGAHLWAGGSHGELSGAMCLYHRTTGTGDFPVIWSRELPKGVVGAYYKTPVTAYEGTPPYTWSIQSPPEGIDIDSESGYLIGTPTEADESAFTIGVTDSRSATDEWRTSLAIASEQLVAGPSTLPSATHRKTYYHFLGVTGGNPPYHCAVVSGTMPAGMAVTEDLVFSGVPLEVGSYGFSVRVADSSALPQEVTLELHFEVDPLGEGSWEVQHAHNRIMDIHFFDENNGIAIGWSGVIIETSDGGRSWSKRLFGSEMIDFDWVGDAGWMVASNRVFYSPDRGRSWTEQSHPLSLLEGVRFFDGLHGCLFGIGIAYTEDGGQTWNASSVPVSHYIHDLFFADLSLGYAGGENETFLKSTDGGKVWTAEVLPEIPGGQSKNRVKLPSTGRTRKTSLPKAEEPPQISCIFFANSLEGWVGTNLQVGFNDYRLYHTVDGGQTWENQKVHGTVYLNNIQFLPDGKTGWVSGLFSSRIWRTTNGGSTWLYTNFTGITDASFWGMQFLDADTGWVLYHQLGDITDGVQTHMEGSVWKTTDGGEDFTQQYGWPDFTDTEPSSPSLDTRSPGPDISEVRFFDSQRGYAVGRETDLGDLRHFKTENGGADWRLVGQPRVNRQIFFTNEWHGWALDTDSRSPLLETTDGGNSWGPRYDLTRRGMLPSDEGPYYWKENVDQKALSSAWFDVFFIDDHHGWLLTTFLDSVFVLHTRDGGATWKKIAEDLSLGYYKSGHLFFVDRENGWLISATENILQTKDGGKSWEQVYSSPDEYYDSLNSIFFPNLLEGWAVGDGGLALHRIPGATTWTPVSLPTEWVLSDVSFSSCGKGWIVGAEDPDNGPPVLLEAENSDFTEGSRISTGVLSHDLRTLDAPDSENLWAYGGFGLGMKYAAPTDAIQVVNESLPDGRVGVPYSIQLEQENGTAPISWQLCGGFLPPGIELSESGLLAGSPEEAATFGFVVAVFDSAGRSASRRFSLVIQPEISPVIAADSLPDGWLREDYASQLEATGTAAPYEWFLTEGALPPGLSLLPIGTIGGVPELTGLYRFEAIVFDGQIPRGSERKQLSIRIRARTSGQPPVGLCDEFPLFCLARDWKKTGMALEGDFDKDGNVNARDACLVFSRAIAALP